MPHDIDNDPRFPLKENEWIPNISLKDKREKENALELVVEKEFMERFEKEVLVPIWSCYVMEVFKTKHEYKDQHFEYRYKIVAQYDSAYYHIGVNREKLYSKEK